SLWLVGLTVVVQAAAIAYAFWSGRAGARAYFGLMLLLTAAIVGVFTAQDLLLFYVFWEAMLIPLYVLIGVWGGAGRLGATIKFVIYTMAGSLLMLAAVIVLGLSQGTFDLTATWQSSSDWLFLGFVAAFAVKAPLFRLHAWLPDAYRESPPEVSAVLSGVVSKAAIYGFIRIAITKFPEPTKDFRTVILVLAAIGLVYGSLLAFRAPDIRGVIAYSSLAQLGLITFGVFAVNDLGLNGAVLQMINHGLITASLFLLAGGIERRAATGEFARLGGFARGRPILATVLMTTGIIGLAVPGSSAFAGEFEVLDGVFRGGEVIPRPHVDWFALAPELMLLGAMGFALIGAVLLPRENRRDFGAFAAALGFAGAFVYAIVIYIHTPDVHSVIVDSVRRDRFGALAQVIIAGAGLLTVGVSYAQRMRDEHIAEYYALLAAAGAGMCFLVTANNLMTLFL